MGFFLCIAFEPGRQGLRKHSSYHKVPQSSGKKMKDTNNFLIIILGIFTLVCTAEQETTQLCSNVPNSGPSGLD